MSFSEEKKQYTLELVDYDNSYSYSLFALLGEVGGFLSDRIAGYFPEYDKYFEFSFEDNGNNTDLEFKRIKSSGPIVGFIGYYLDLSSGYILLNTEKTNDYIPLANLYKWIEDKNDIKVNPKIMMSLIERYKIGDINHDEFSSELYQTSWEDRTSIIGKLLSEESGNVRKQEGEPLFDSIVRFYGKCNHTIDSISNEFDYYDNDGYELSPYEILEKNYPGVGEFLRALQLSFRKSGEIDSAITYGKQNGLGPADDSVFKALSAMIYTGDSYDKRGTKGTRPYNNMTDTDSLIMNLRDIVEEREDDTIVDFDDLALRKSKPSKDEIYEVIDKIGVREYMSGRELGNITRGLGSRTEVADYINRTTAAIDMGDSLELDTYNISLNDVVSSFRKTVRFYRGSLELIDSITR